MHGERVDVHPHPYDYHHRHHRPQVCRMFGTNPMHGTIGFDNILMAWMTIFQVRLNVHMRMYLLHVHMHIYIFQVSLNLSISTGISLSLSLSPSFMACLRWGDGHGTWERACA